MFLVRWQKWKNGHRRGGGLCSIQPFTAPSWWNLHHLLQLPSIILFTLLSTWGGKSAKKVLNHLGQEMAHLALHSFCAQQELAIWPNLDAWNGGAGKCGPGLVGPSQHELCSRRTLPSLPQQSAEEREESEQPAQEWASLPGRPKHWGPKADETGPGGEVNSERDHVRCHLWQITHITYDIPYMCNLKYGTNEPLWNRLSRKGTGERVSRRLGLASKALHRGCTHDESYCTDREPSTPCDKP